MTGTTFDILFLGEYICDTDREGTRRRLQRRLKLSDENARRLFSGRRVAVKRGVDAATASRYRKVFRRAGALVRIRQIEDPHQNPSLPDVRSEEVPSVLIALSDGIPTSVREEQQPRIGLEESEDTQLGTMAQEDSPPEQLAFGGASDNEIRNLSLAPGREPTSVEVVDPAAAFRPLIYRLRQANQQRGEKIFAVSVVETAANSSSCTHHLARSCVGATGFGDILLVDMNLHHLPEAPAPAAAPGWAEWLDTESDQPLFDRVQRDPGNGLCVLPRGGKGKSLLPQDLERLVDSLRAFEGIVILDCPPWFAGPEAVSICSAADGVVVVVEAGHSRRPLVRQMIADLRQMESNGGCELLGVVMNQRRYPIPQWLYRQLF